MKYMKRLFLIMSVLTLSLYVQAQNLTILHLNDTHSHIEPVRSGEYMGKGGVIEQAVYIDEVRGAESPENVLLLHAGDFSQGTSYFTEMGGDMEIAVLNAMSFDAVCLGNHEFDNGVEELSRRLAGLEMPVLCANYDFTSTPLEGLVRPYAIIEKAGRKIGIIGLLTDVSSVVDPQIASMLKYQDPASIADKYALMLKDMGCDLIIALTHLGYEGELYTDQDLVRNTGYLDVVIGGHSHTFLKKQVRMKDRRGRKVVIVTDGKWGLDIGKLTVK